MLSKLVRYLNNKEIIEVTSFATETATVSTPGCSAGGVLTADGLDNRLVGETEARPLCSCFRPSTPQVFSDLATDSFD